jgi:hypothetical protein
MALISPISNRRPSQVLCETLVYEIPVFDGPQGKISVSSFFLADIKLPPGNVRFREQSGHCV